MQIKPMAVADYGALRALYLMSRRTTFGWLAPESFKLADFDADVAGERVWVAHADGQVAGFASIWEKENFLHTLFVHPEFLRRGIGSALLSACLATRLASSGSPPAMTLKCLTQNLPALDFYASFGWTRISQGTSPEGDYLLLRFESLA
jgi:ribosomal protein S18 acetylase RimI-like enzyme